MKRWEFSFFILLMITVLGCNSDNAIKEKQLELKEKELDIREKELQNQHNITKSSNNQSEKNQQQNYTSSKFIYVVFKVEQPRLFHSDQKYVTDINNIPTDNLPEFNSVSYKDFIYSSDIKEIYGYNEDKQYEYMDLMEAKMRNQLSIIDMNFTSEINFKVSDATDKKQFIENYKSKINDRKIKVFDSYKEASIDRNSNKTF